MEFKVEGEIRLPEWIFDARFHPKSEANLFAVVTIDGNVHLFESGVIKSQIKRHHKGSSIRKVRFTKDGRMVTIAKTVKIHDLQSNQTTQTLRRDDDKSSTFYSVKPLDNFIIGAGDDDGTLFVWDTRTPETPIFLSSDCEQYISDIDAKYDARKLIVCTSGEGTLTAYDMRAKKMIEPQSELFEAGFQCLKMVEAAKKVVVGGEDGAIYIFNQNEWAHTSGKFSISSDAQNRGKCSIDCLDMLPDNNTFVAGCSDGKVRSFTLWPHQILAENSFCKRSSIESIHVNPNLEHSQILITGENYINIVNFRQVDDEEESNEPSNELQSESRKHKLAAIDEATTASDSAEVPPTDAKGKNKTKASNEDYLEIFK